MGKERQWYLPRRHKGHEEHKERKTNDRKDDPDFAFLFSLCSSCSLCLRGKKVPSWFSAGRAEMAGENGNGVKQLWAVLLAVEALWANAFLWGLNRLQAPKKYA